MKRLRIVWINVCQTCLRVLPFRCETGLVRIGEPGRDAPVLLTCNFQLTVERLKKAVAGHDVYLLIANSRGVNVWCAATGGLLTHHDVISVLKTSGVASLVDHRRLILPQLAATGIESRMIRAKTGWSVVWGPVDLRDIPSFLSSGLGKTREMRTVKFGWSARIEMAVAWAFPMSFLALAGYPLWKDMVCFLIGWIWLASIVIFLSFPLYRSWLRTERKRIGFVFFDFGQSGVALILWGVFVVILVAYAVLIGRSPWLWTARWTFASLVVVLILSLDLMGSTPMYKSGLHEDSLLGVRLDEDRCRGIGACEQVCPTDVFEMGGLLATVSLPRSKDCVQCGACIVQCPCDALCFVSPRGELVLPDTVRRFKLNLMGKRLVRADSRAPGIS